MYYSYGYDLYETLLALSLGKIRLWKRYISAIHGKISLKVLYHKNSFKSISVTFYLVAVYLFTDASDVVKFFILTDQMVLINFPYQTS